MSADIRTISAIALEGTLARDTREPVTLVGHSVGGLVAARLALDRPRLVRALVLQVLYSIRSERLLVEQLDYNLLFRWFVGLSVDEAVWDHSTFTKNRDRLIEAGVARKLLRRVGRKARRAGLLSSEHFSVDGTLIEAWSAIKSMRRRDGSDDPPPPGRNPHVDFHGERRALTSQGPPTEEPR